MTKYEIIKMIFETNGNLEKANLMSKNNSFVFYGIPSKLRKRITMPLIKEDMARRVIDWSLLDDCFNDEHREFIYFALDYLFYMKDHIIYDDIVTLRNYASVLKSCDTVDYLDKIISYVGLSDKRVDDNDYWCDSICVETGEVNSCEKKRD